MPPNQNIEMGRFNCLAFKLELKHQLLLGLKAACQFSDGPYTVGCPDPQTFVLGLELHHLFPWVSSLPTADL